MKPDAAAAADDEDYSEEEETQTMQNQKKPTKEKPTNQPALQSCQTKTKTAGVVF